MRLRDAATILAFAASVAEAATDSAPWESVYAYKHFKAPVCFEGESRFSFVDAGSVAAGSVRSSSVDAAAMHAGFVDAGVLAENGVRACLLSGAQSIAGQKVWTDLMQNTSSFPRNLGTHSVDVSQINYQGIMVGTGPIVPTYDDSPLILEGRQSNTSITAGVLVRAATFRDAGSYFSVNSGMPCDSQLFGVGSDGTVTIGAAPTPACSDAVDILNRVALRDGTGASGHVFAESYNGLYMHQRGMLAANHAGLLPDAGHPTYDGGRDVQCEDDGGCYYAYAGSHGNFTISTPEAQYGGWLFEVRNSDGFGNTKFLIDSYGGFAQLHGMTRAQFPECPGVAIQSNLGQFSRGAAAGEMLWAGDTEHWYVCKAAGWKQLKDEDDQ